MINGAAVVGGLLGGLLGGLISGAFVSVAFLIFYRRIGRSRMIYYEDRLRSPFVKVDGHQSMSQVGRFASPPLALELTFLTSSDLPRASPKLHQLPTIVRVPCLSSVLQARATGRSQPFPLVTVQLCWLPLRLKWT